MKKEEQGEKEVRGGLLVKGAVWFCELKTPLRLIFVCQNCNLSTILKANGLIKAVF